MSQYRHALAKVMEAASCGNEGPSPLSTGEKLMAALALNRPDWLSGRGYTVVKALERVGDEWVAFLPRVVKEVADLRCAGGDVPAPQGVPRRALCVTPCFCFRAGAGR